jgi:uncharacterized protein YcbX
VRRGSSRFSLLASRYLPTMQISSLHYYPIKGCRGHALERAQFDARGVVDDRRLMLVDARGRFLSQRELATLATIEPMVSGRELTVRAEGHRPLELLLDPEGAERQVTVWNSIMLANDQGDAAAAWFSNVLHAPVRLVRWGDRSQRPLDPMYSPRADAETTFTDGYPALITLEASLADLNTRLDVPIPMGRFRPNIVVTGGSAWDEDQWKALRVGDMVFDAVKPCARCVVPTTDQQSGVRHPRQEPLRTLASFRTIPHLGAIFGQNLVHRGPGHLVVGDSVTVQQ